MLRLGRRIARTVREPSRSYNPAARDEPKWDRLETRQPVMRSCSDCHSNKTKVAWFEQPAPVHWYIANHVREGRAALNFSQWHSAAGGGARDAAKPVRNGSMPPSYYAWFGLHAGSRLSATNAKALAEGLEKTIAADPPSSP